MRNFTKLIAVAAVACCFGTTANAKEKDYEETPHMFVGLQGGVQNTWDKEFLWKTLTPTASVSFGGYFDKTFGARLHFNGIWNQASTKTVMDGQRKFYDYNYLTTSADALINLCTLFGKKDHYPVNVIFIAGLGANYAWGNEQALSLTQNPPICDIPFADAENRWAFNGRLGLGLDVPICKNVSFNIEADYNHIVPNMVSFATDHHQITCQAGLNIRFGHKRKPKVEAPEVWETRVDTIWYDDAVFTPRVENGTATWNVHYLIRESDFEADEQLKAIGDFLKDHRECKVDIKSYADVQTGNPKINMEYSKQRCEKAVKALVDAGVPAASISSSYYGDTVQPFAENDKNRVSIIVATGLKDVNDKNMVKKFKTKDVRVRVE